MWEGRDGDCYLGLNPLNRYTKDEEENSEKYKSR